MSTPIALAFETRRKSGVVWRAVEHQHTVSTRKIVDTRDEQELLEEILEASKPHYPTGTESLHYLLKTPFRHYPPYPYGSRFRRINSREGVFYASEHIRTALAEFSSYRVRFFEASPQTPLPRKDLLTTVFSVKYATRHCLDLTLPPFVKNRSRWVHPTDYSATQDFADQARAAKADVLRYESVRDSAGGVNVALLNPKAFALNAPVDHHVWILYIAATEINCIRTGLLGNEERWTFER
ncbi:MAG: RES family NAD+ phosphorylase [Gammaproteobacteria bacterium]|nr:RES family NAD+ phosphorylase [Gammaproteobacteria bacterium]